jgi:L-fuculose-phosphate aldolase
VILLANHGVVTYGRDVVTAYFLLEKVEQTACITFVARMLGGEKRLTVAEVEKLGAISMKSYGKDFSGKFRGRTAGPDREMTEAEIRAYIDEQLTARGLKQ